MHGIELLSDLITKVFVEQPLASPKSAKYMFGVEKKPSTLACVIFKTLFKTLHI